MEEIRDAVGRGHVDGCLFKANAVCRATRRAAIMNDSVLSKHHARC